MVPSKDYDTLSLQTKSISFTQFTFFLNFFIEQFTGISKADCLHEKNQNEEDEEK